MEERKSLEERLLAKIKHADNGCWTWTGCVVRGYGQIAMSGSRKKLRAHRASYIVFKGPIPDDLVIDHLCRNPLCIDPDHLEAVTPLENSRRGDAPPIKIRRSGRCMRGHEINDTNTYFHPITGNIKHCRVCEREKRRKRKGSAA